MDFLNCSIAFSQPYSALESRLISTKYSIQDQIRRWQLSLHMISRKLSTEVAKFKVLDWDNFDLFINLLDYNWLIKL